jgi:hypothetical protein
MSKQGMKLARAYGEALLRFNSLAEAERALFGMRDDLLHALRHAADSSPLVRLDDSPESLKRLEIWYFELLTQGGFAAVGLSRDVFEAAIPIYFGAVLAANVSSFKWFVEEFPFARGRYDIGVRTPQGSVALSGGWNLEREPNNKRRQSLWRRYRLLAS